MTTIRYTLLLVALAILAACKPSPEPANELESERLQPAKIETGKPKTDKRNKATVYDQPLWEEELMEKQLLYCVDQHIDLEEIDPYRFCACFLNKARYTHEIEFLDQAYEDQEGWVIDCMESSPKQDF